MEGLVATRVSFVVIQKCVMHCERKECSTILLSSEDCLQICEKAPLNSDSTNNCAKSKTKRGRSFLCESCDKIVKAETRRKKRKALSAMPEILAKQQDPSSNASFD
jgi:hypothetical protein